MSVTKSMSEEESMKKKKKKKSEEEEEVRRRRRRSQKKKKKSEEVRRRRNQCQKNVSNLIKDFYKFVTNQRLKNQQAFVIKSYFIKSICSCFFGFVN